MTIIHLGEATPQSYRETRTRLIILADQLTQRIAALEPIRDLTHMNELLEADSQRRIVIEMIASCSYVIEWLETGRRPGNQRGIERRAGYQREVLTDPALLPFLGTKGHTSGGTGSGGDQATSQRLASALRGLTDRERDCLTLSQGEGFSHAEVADMLGISKSSVGTYLLRALRKVAINISQGERVGTA